ncbi:hypothetical protein [Streptomyces sp. NPDC052701]|uniref:hypothetical protein n=1 Tax=Streptomyces sp. NPDC052701 TaxID=3155533 RepID=UPI00342EFF9F
MPDRLRADPGGLPQPARMPSPAASLPSSFSDSRHVLATRWVYGVSASSSQASQLARSTVRVASITAVVGAS